MSGPIFDPALLPLRRERARRMGGEAFLHARAFDEILDRIGAVSRGFRSAMIYGHGEPDWPQRLAAIGVRDVTLVEPGSDTPLPIAPELCVSIGALDTAEPLPALLAALRATLAADGLLVGAIVGGDSLPALRTAMRAADGDDGASAHIHPRIPPASMAALLNGAGFVMPVVDVDRVRLRYSNLDALVRDLRGMAGTNRLLARPRRPILRTGLAAARRAFDDLAEDGRTTEIIEIIHFAGWTAGPKSAENSRLTQS